MTNASFEVPVPKNEPINAYGPGSSERASLEAALKTMAEERGSKRYHPS